MPVDAYFDNARATKSWKGRPQYTHGVYEVYLPKITYSAGFGNSACSWYPSTRAVAQSNLVNSKSVGEGRSRENYENRVQAREVEAQRRRRK